MSSVARACPLPSGDRCPAMARSGVPVVQRPKMSLKRLGPSPSSPVCRSAEAGARRPRTADAGRSVPGGGALLAFPGGAVAVEEVEERLSRERLRAEDAGSGPCA
jgi:hypothetical protein